MKTAEHKSECPFCEDQIEVGDNIQYCHVRRSWGHLSCPWKSDEGYRPDMIILDLPVITELPTELPTEVYCQRSLIERLWKSISDFFGF